MESLASGYVGVGYLEMNFRGVEVSDMAVRSSAFEGSEGDQELRFYASFEGAHRDCVWRSFLLAVVIL